MIESQATIPYLDVSTADFYTYSDAVRRAQAVSWYARGLLTDFVALRHAEVTALLRDPRMRQGTYRWLHDNGIDDGPLAEFWRFLMLNLVGEEHARIRRLVSKAFTPPAVDRLRPYMRAQAERLADALIEAGSGDFFPAFAGPLPLQTICELLGIPDERRTEFGEWSGEMIEIFGLELIPKRWRLEAGIVKLLGCIDDAIADRRRAPGEDLVSGLIAAEEDGDRLTSDELRMLLLSLVFLGMDTTRTQLALMMYGFAQHPEQWQLITDRPELVGQAVDEVIRCYPVVATVSRVPREDGEFQGVPFRAGANIVLSLVAANRDPLVFGENNAFDITVAGRPRSLSFGGGIYHCLGNWLARAEVQEALPILTARLTDLHLTEEPQWRKRGMVGPLTMPIGFRAR